MRPMSGKSTTLLICAAIAGLVTAQLSVAQERTLGAACNGPPGLTPDQAYPTIPKTGYWRDDNSGHQAYFEVHDCGKRLEAKFFTCDDELGKCYDVTFGRLLDQSARYQGQIEMGFGRTPIAIQVESEERMRAFPNCILTNYGPFCGGKGTTASWVPQFVFGQQGLECECEDIREELRLLRESQSFFREALAEVGPEASAIALEEAVDRRVRATDKLGGGKGSGGGQGTLPGSMETDALSCGITDKGIWDNVTEASYKAKWNSTYQHELLHYNLCCDMAAAQKADLAAGLSFARAAPSYLRWISQNARNAASDEIAGYQVAIEHLEAWLAENCSG